MIIQSHQLVNNPETSAGEVDVPSKKGCTRALDSYAGIYAEYRTYACTNCSLNS